MATIDDRLSYEKTMEYLSKAFVKERDQSSFEMVSMSRMTGLLEDLSL